MQETGLLGAISGGTIWRWLSKDASRPWFFPHDSPLRSEGRTCPRPCTSRAGKATPSTTTTSSSRRREDVHSGVAVPMPPRRPAPAAQMRAEHECKRCGACGTTSQPSTCTAPTWSDAVESQYRNHALPALGRAGHGHRSLPAGPARLLDRRQRLPRTVPAIHPTGGDLGPQVAARPYPVPCQLTQSDRDLLLDRATQGPDAKRLRRYRGTRPPPPLREPLRQDRPNRSNGSFARDDLTKLRKKTPYDPAGLGRSASQCPPRRRATKRISEVRNSAARVPRGTSTKPRDLLRLADDNHLTARSLQCRAGLHHAARPLQRPFRLAPAA